MSSDSTKKRRIAVGNIGGADDGSSTAAIIAEMKAHMMCMQNKIDSMQSEMDGMKSRLSRMDELEDKCQHQEEKCNTLEDRCDSLQRSIQILNKENKWEYSAPSIPTSHWTGLGFDEDYINDMEELVKEIKSYTSKLRSGVYIEINLGEETEEEGGRILQHDDILLPHWKELVNAIQLSPSDAFKSKSFTLQNVQLTSSAMDLLTLALKGKQFEMLYLENNSFVNTFEGVTFAVEVVKSTSQLKTFDLVNNQLETRDNVDLVLDAVISHPSIESVCLENCLGGDINSYDVLCTLLKSGKQFDTLDLERNSIQTNGDTSIPDCISNNPPLKNILLSGNKLNDDDAILIAQSLKHNTNLQCVHLFDNDLTYIGYQALSRAVYDPTSLNSVYDCNHTCHINLDEIEFEIGRVRDYPLSLDTNIGHPSSSVRSEKIHYILSLRHKEGSNVQHLNSEFDGHDVDGALTLKFVPKVLEAVYKHSNTASSRCGRHVPHLSIMYEILRGWKMPELYGNSERREYGLAK